jgi:uncharacterized phage infection (PIP) family protein YhgE
MEKKKVVNTYSEHNIVLKLQKEITALDGVRDNLEKLDDIMDNLVDIRCAIAKQSITKRKLKKKVK